MPQLYFLCGHESPMLFYKMGKIQLLMHTISTSNIPNLEADREYYMRWLCLIKICRLLGTMHIAVVIFTKGSWLSLIFRLAKISEGLGVPSACSCIHLITHQKTMLSELCLECWSGRCTHSFIQTELVTQLKFGSFIWPVLLDPPSCITTLFPL